MILNHIKRLMAVLLVNILLFSALPRTTVQAAPSPADTVADCVLTHTVRRGENLYRIALLYGTTYQTLQQLNGLANSNRIYVGQRLCVQTATSLPVEWTEVRDIIALTTVRIRTGPGTEYATAGRLFAGEGAGVSGISPDHKWWRIECATGASSNCWVSANPNLTRPMELPGNEPEPGPIRETGEAVVESVSIHLTGSNPPQALAVLRGYLPDGCVTIAEVRQVRESTTFRIRMSTQRRIDALCQAVPVSFEERVQLDTVGLPAGTYDVRVNDLVTSFTLDAGQGPDGGSLLPVHQTPVRYVQAQANLYLRSGPGTRYSIIGSVAEGQTALVTGISLDGGWWRVICPNDRVGNCFISADPALSQVTDGF